jgi:hypothetical protein
VNKEQRNGVRFGGRTLVDHFEHGRHSLDLFAAFPRTTLVLGAGLTRFKLPTPDIVRAMAQFLGRLSRIDIGSDI